MAGIAQRTTRVLRLARFARVLWQVSRDYPVWYVNDYGAPTLAVSHLRRPVVVLKIVGDFAWEYSRRHGLTTDGIDDFQTRSYGRQVAALKRLQRLCARSAQRVIVPSRYLGGLVEAWGVPTSCIRVIYNAVSIDGLTREPVTSPAPGPILLTAGRLAPWKGMDHLLEILSRIRADVPSVRLVVAGDGPVEASLRAQATRLGLDASVTWLGKVTRERLISWMEASDAFVLLSEYEGFPHVAIEAMASGLPVALSGAGGNPELVTDGHDGLLLDPCHHAESAATLVRLLTDEPWRRTLAERGKTRASDFSWLTLMRQTLDVFAEVTPTEGQTR